MPGISKFRQSAWFGNKGEPSSRQFVALLYAALVVLALSIATASFVQDYHLTREELEDRAQAYAVSMATDVRWYVDVARQSLSRVAAQLPASETGQDYSAVLSGALGDLPLGVVIAVYDASGSSVAFLGQTGHPVNVSDRLYFQELRDGQPWVISNLISDRVTGTMTFAVGMPVHTDGKFSGAAVAYAPMAIFSHAWLSVGGKDSNAFLVHKDGWLTARLPPIDTLIYDSPVQRDFIDSFFGSDNGSYWAAASPIDGVARVLGYARVANTPLAAVIGISPADSLGRFWDRVILMGAVLTPILALIGLVTWRVRNLIVAQEDTVAALAKSNARNEGLLLEIHHRVKNNLQSALSLTRIHVKDPNIIGEIQPRILAMISAHEHIYLNEGFSEVKAEPYITELAQKTIYASSEAIQLRTNIENVSLASELAMPLGQLVNEAVINAIKYGFPDGLAGVIDITLWKDGDGWANLTIHDNGMPLPESLTNGIGTRLMNSFAAQLRGSVSTISGDDGVTVSLRFPLS